MIRLETEQPNRPTNVVRGACARSVQSAPVHTISASRLAIVYCSTGPSQGKGRASFQLVIDRRRSKSTGPAGPVSSAHQRGRDAGRSRPIWPRVRQRL